MCKNRQTEPKTYVGAQQ